MKRMTKKAFYEKARNLARHHSHVVIYFKQRNSPGINYMRRRKITSEGKCFVSYLDGEGKWTKYQTSCFMCDVRSTDFERTIGRMRRHDYQCEIEPLMLEWGKGKDMKRIEL